MKRLVWASLTFTTAAVVVASCVPDFQFREQSGAGGGTSGGGGSVDAGVPTTTTTTTGAGAGGAGGGGGAGGSGGSVSPVVPCGDAGVECNPGEHCCYHATYLSCDRCAAIDCVAAAPPGCNDAGNYAIITCDDPSDCEAGKKCCMSYVQQMSKIYLSDSICSDTCSGSQFQLCNTDADCQNGQTCTRELPYVGYYACQ